MRAKARHGMLSPLVPGGYVDSSLHRNNIVNPTKAWMGYQRGGTSPARAIGGVIPQKNCFGGNSSSASTEVRSLIARGLTRRNVSSFNQFRESRRTNPVTIGEDNLFWCTSTAFIQFAAITHIQGSLTPELEEYKDLMYI